MDALLRDFSDPHRDHGKGQCISEPHLAMPPTAAGESGPQGSGQSPAMPSSRPPELTGGSVDVPGSVHTQKAATAPDEALQAILDELIESFEQKAQTMSHEQGWPTAGSQNPHIAGMSHMSVPDCQKNHVTASMLTVPDGGGQMQDTSLDQTRNSIPGIPLWGGPSSSLQDNQPHSRGQTTVPLVQQIFHSGAQAIPVCDQSLYLNQMTNAWSGQRLNGDQTVTLSNGHTLSGGDQLAAVPRPGLGDLPELAGIQEQLPAQNGNFPKKSSALPNNSQRSRPYVCPQQGCGKSYWRPSYLRVHQRTHSGKCGFECRAGTSGPGWVCLQSFTELPGHCLLPPALLLELESSFTPHASFSLRLGSTIR